MNEVEAEVLHALRCMGFSSVQRVAEVAAMDAGDTEGVLLALAVSGLVTYHGGGFGGWGVTDAGKAADALRVAAELDAAGLRSVLTKAYGRFEKLNVELLDLCTAWQMLPGGVLNDHRDAGYDRRVLERLADFDGRAQLLLAELAGVAGRFGGYRVRLGGALRRVRAGERAMFADDLASYHGVWFQLHEDLLVTLGMPR